MGILQICASGDIKQIFIFQPSRHSCHPVPGSLGWAVSERVYSVGVMRENQMFS